MVHTINKEVLATSQIAALLIFTAAVTSDLTLQDIVTRCLKAWRREYWRLHIRSFPRHRSNVYPTTQWVKAFTSQRNLRVRCVLFGSPRAYLRRDRSELVRQSETEWVRVSHGRDPARPRYPTTREVVSRLKILLCYHLLCVTATSFLYKW
jgi:hypothetical protein